MPHLERLAGEHPFDEGLHGQLMLALYRGSRQSEALAVYHRLRHALDEELGVPPGPAVRTLFDRILRDDAGLGPQPVTVPAPAARRRFRPGQLPAALTGFVGRAAELSALDGLLDTGRSSAVAISALSGTAGVGKTNP